MPRRKNRSCVKNRKMGRIEKSNCTLKRSENHITKEIFCLFLRPAKNEIENWKFQLFLTHLLVLLALAGRPRFCLIFKALVLSLIIGLAISKTKFISGEIALGLSG